MWDFHSFLWAQGGSALKGLSSSSHASPSYGLEVARLVVSALTPLSVITIGFCLNRRMKRIEHLQWASQKVIEKRLRIYEEITPMLNDALCFFNYIGNWQEITPPEMIKLKRKLDKIAYINAPLLPPEFMLHYNNFMNACYSTYQKWGAAAGLRTPWKIRQEAAQVAGLPWEPEWSKFFVEDETQCADPQEVRAAYGRLISYFVTELGIGVRADVIDTGKIPHNMPASNSPKPSAPVAAKQPAPEKTSPETTPREQLASKNAQKRKKNRVASLDQRVQKN